MSELPVAGTPRQERADAARNRERVLAAARALFAERGVREVTMSEVARKAGVAKGTVFHRFGDRAGLALALVDEHERALQDAILRGPPPLGPGAPPRERLLAFLGALTELTVAHRELLLEVDGAAPAARYRTGAYRAWLQHVVLLLGELDVAGDRALLAHLLLAPLAADLVSFLREDEGVGADALAAAVRELAARVVG
ncbi:MAG TPA: helix-turn-helix domain-containing protein [Solirubrobacteraceae bacterium]|jgi:AcrR family transcriptional regulator